MATSYRLSQVQGTAGTGTYATLYNTGASTTAIVSNIIVTNQAATAVTVRIGVTTTAGTPTASEWLVSDFVVAPNDVFMLGPISIGNSRFIRVSSSAATCNFSAAVAEIS